ncbi:hypothetical protein [Candidatus Mancarchaeum acidiphilum]|uniref:hypothetical protein n=1 Tax=Candidatus Mancarchaeum acidiphilum TaxID=1920749 RepID=UPI000F527DE3|nr:hypothetical protein [Candidatus Mancarchaeum acidiphilum]
MSKVETLKEMKEEMQNYLVKYTDEIENYDNKSQKTNDKKIKTYIIESNNPKPEDVIWPENINLIPTKDRNLKLIKTKISNNQGISYLDCSDPRFWYLHTNIDSNNTKKIINDLVNHNKSKLDFCWYSSNFLEKKVGFGKSEGFNIKFRNEFLTKKEKNEENSVKEFSMLLFGGGAKEVLDSLRQKGNPLISNVTLTQIKQTFNSDSGFVKESIGYKGSFTLNKGDSIINHFNTLDSVKNKYFNIINRLENEYRIKFSGNESGIKIDGMYSLIEFNKEIEDLNLFIDRIFSTKKPFRLWGIPQYLEKDFVRVLAVDLHTFDKFTLEITPNYMRIFLSENSCGNVIVRLFTNLQLFFDSQIKLKGYDDEQFI